MIFKLEKPIVLSVILAILFTYSCKSRLNDRAPGNQDAVEENEISDKNSIEITNIFFTIPFDEIVKNKRKVPLSEFAESVEFIQFENTEKSLLGSIRDIQITPNFIFLHHNGIGLLTQYTSDGKFVRHIGSVGRGPKEYLLMRKFSLDEENELVYIHTNWTRKILVYNFDGEYIRAIRFDAIERMQVVWSRESFFISYSTPYAGKEPYLFIEHNVNGDTLQFTLNYNFWNEEDMSEYSASFWGQNMFYRYKKQLHMRSIYGDTVYSFNRQNEISPKYSINLGKHKIPDELVYERKSTKTMPKDCYWIGVHETSNYIFIPYGYHYNRQTRKQINRDRGCVLYNKNTHEGVAVIENSLGGFVNDLSGGPDFKPIYTTDKKAYAAITALDMKLYLESEDFKNQSVKFPEQKEKLIQISRTLKEDDNHFLMVVNLK